MVYKDMREVANIQKIYTIVINTPNNEYSKLQTFVPVDTKVVSRC
jgi:hypothetical protein